MKSYFKLFILVTFLLLLSHLFSQDSSANNEQQIINALKSNDFLNKEMINKLSPEQIMELMKARIDAPKQKLEEELDYYKKSGIPNFLTPNVTMISSIFCFITIFFIVFTTIFINYKRSLIFYKTIDNMVDKNIDIPSELIIPRVKTKKIISNLKKGILLVATGISVSAFLIIAEGFSEGNWAIGLIPLSF